MPALSGKAHIPIKRAFFGLNGNDRFNRTFEWFIILSVFFIDTLILLK